MIILADSCISPTAAIVFIVCFCITFIINLLRIR